MSSRRLALHQLSLEQRAFWRNPQAAFFTVALPLGLVVIFGAIAGGDTVPGRPELSTLALLVPGFLAFGIIIAAFGNLAATIASLRADGVLKRIRTTPLPASTYLAGHPLNVVVVCAVITLATVAAGWILHGVTPTPGGGLTLAATLALGVPCFAALGLAISAAIPTAESAGPITNGAYVPLAIISGAFDARLELPGWLDQIVGALPIRALTEGLRAAYDPAMTSPAAEHLAILALWTVAGIALALRVFRWHPT
jgi:ABC-2 type transport system permease protein